MPALPVLAVGGGQVFLELTVGRDGRVTAVRPLRTTPPFTAAVVDAVGDWEFLPAEEQVTPGRGRGDEPQSRRPVMSSVLVAAVFRPPSLNVPTLGERPRDIASPSSEMPFPLTTIAPPFPPLAYSSGVVLVEVRLDGSGAIADVGVIRSAPPFDDAAVQAARQWRFRPARVRGMPVPAFAYVVFGFPVPVVETVSDPERRVAFGLPGP